MSAFINVSVEVPQNKQIEFLDSTNEHLRALELAGVVQDWRYDREVDHHRKQVSA